MLVGPNGRAVSHCIYRAARQNMACQGFRHLATPATEDLIAMEPRISALANVAAHCQCRQAVCGGDCMQGQTPAGGGSIQHGGSGVYEAALHTSHINPLWRTLAY